MEARHDQHVHFYDTRARRIACGVRGIEHRSTKHVRSVTCPTCVALLARPAREHGGEAAPAGGGMGL